MSAIHYKFSSSNDYKNVTFDGLSISVLDCKRSIMQKEKLKMTEVDLLITNAQSLKDYKDESDLIPKNTALLVRRIPFGATHSADKSKVYIVKKNDSAASKKSLQDSSYLTLDQLRKTEDLAAANATEQDKIKAMMAQSTTEYDPSKYIKPPKPGSYQRYDSSKYNPYVKCFKCHQTGHYATQCRLSKPLTERPKTVRPATGIPRSHMIQVNKDARGAMLTPDGQYVVPFIDKKGYDVGKKEKPPFLPDTNDDKEDDEDEPVPDELICLLCKEIMEDAVVIPCCGNSYCDECIRNTLLESEDHECPTCHKKNISPDSLIANKFLRQAVNKFRNETGISRKKSKNAPVWPRPAPVEAKPTPPPQPTKVTYGPPVAKTQSSSTGAGYVVKARSAQVYAAQGYTIKKAAHTTSSATVATTTLTTTPETIHIKEEPPPSTPESELSSGNTTLGSDERVGKPDVDLQPPGVSPPGLTSIAVRSLKMEDEGAEESSGGESPSRMRTINIRKFGQCLPDSAKVLAIEAKPVVSEPKISPLNMMVERPDRESPPPPPPPLPQADAEQPKVERSPSLETEAQVEIPKPDPASPEETPIAEQPAPREQKLPSLLDDMPPDFVTHFPIQSQAINITLKNAPPVQAKPEPSVPIIDPPLHRPTPQKPPSLLNTAPSLNPLVQQPPMNPRPPMMGIPPPGMHPPGLNVAPPGPMMRLPPPHLMPSSMPPPSVPTSLPPPGMMRPLRQRIGLPPPLGVMPPGVMPPHIPFPPPPGIPPPTFLSQRPPSQPTHVGQVGPPPPGTGTPPTIVAVSTAESRKRSERRSSPRPKRESKESRSFSKSRKSKLAMMSDQFTKEQKERVASRKRKPKRGRSDSRSGSESYSSSSYSSSSSRSSSRSSYSSSGSASYSSSDSYSDSRSPTPVRRRKRRDIVKRGKKADSRSYSRSLSPSPARKKRGRKIQSKKRKDSKSPVKRRQRRRRSRSADDNSPRTGPRHRRKSRSRSRDRRRRTPKDEPGIPGMPPQSVLDYERDIALYDYYKQKYEQDWLRKRIHPPSPFKRFINYDPTKFPPPSSRPAQPVLREIPAHPTRIPVLSQPPPGLYSQPPPPGDATPTDENAGIYPYRDRTPERFIMQQPPATWDPVMFDSNMAERARILRDEEYYANLHNKLRDDQRWAEQREYPDHPPRYDPRGRPDSRGRERFMDDRKRRGRTPPVERGRRSWEVEGDRWSSRRRREMEDSRSYRNSRDRGDAGVKRRDLKEDTRASRRGDEPRSPRKRGRDHAASLRESSQSNKKSRESRRSPEGTPEPEPFPPGEGDATPVRDESRVEFSNESIKIKVVNDKVKQRPDRRKERERGSKKGEHPQTAALIKDSDSKPRRVVKSREERLLPRREVKSRSSSEIKEKPAPVVVPDERSPTPTLDENISPVKIEDALPEPDVLDVHAKVSVSDIDQPLLDEPTKSPVKLDKGKIEEKATKISEHRRAKKPVKIARRAPVKSRSTKKVNSPAAIEGSAGENREQSRPEYILKDVVPKSRWESDDDTAPERIEAPKEKPKGSPKVEKPFDSKPIKQRKIQIKKPKSKITTELKKEVPIEKYAEKSTESLGKSAVKADKKPPASSAGDSRRVIVSSTSYRSASKQTMQPSTVKSTARILRPSVSTIDEASFEPDYNDDNGSEKALSNYAPSDFENDTNLDPIEDDNERSSKRSGDSRKPNHSKEREHRDEEMDIRRDSVDADEPYEESSKKKKRKKKKHKKHHRQYEDEDYDDDDDDDEAFKSEIDEPKSDRQSSKVKKEERSRRRGSSKHDKYQDEASSQRDLSKSKKVRRHPEKADKSHKHRDRNGDSASGRKRKRERERDEEEEFSAEEQNREERKWKGKSRRHPKEKRRRTSERNDEISLDEESCSRDEEEVRSPTPQDRRKHKKRQKHKKSRRGESSPKKVKTVASRIRISK